MRYAQIRKMDVSNGEGIGVALFTQGCNLHCKECHNSNLWSFQGGTKYTEETKQKILELIKPKYVTRLSILGGEPLEECNIFQLALLINSVHETKPSLEIWVWTGYTYEQLQKKEKNINYLTFILDNIDYLIDGPFVQEKKDVTLKFRGSSNQRILNMKELRPK